VCEPNDRFASTRTTVVLGNRGRGGEVTGTEGDERYENHEIDRGWVLIWFGILPYLPGECLLDFIRGASIKILKAMSSQTLNLLRAFSLAFCLVTV